GYFCGYCARRSARAAEPGDGRDGRPLVGDAGALRELRGTGTARAAGGRAADYQADACGPGGAGGSVAAAHDGAIERLRARAGYHPRGAPPDNRARETVAAGANAASELNG